MARLALLLTTFASLAAWAGAQGPPPSLSAADRVNLFKANRTLLENLVNDGITLADADDPLKRAEGSRATSLTLSNYLKRAATEDQNPQRVVELAELMHDVLRDGLAPNLEEAARIFPPDSPQAAQLADLRRKSTADLDTFAQALPTAGKVAENEVVKKALAQLFDLRGRLAK